MKTGGTEETYHLLDRTTRDSGKSARATVYYSEEAGRKVVHFFKLSL